VTLCTTCVPQKWGLDGQRGQIARLVSRAAVQPGDGQGSGGLHE